MSPPAVDQPPIHLFDHTKPPTSNPGRQRHLSNVRKYGSPLPILLQTQPIKSSQSQSFLSSYLPSIFSPSHAIESPRSTGIYHPLTRSVIVTGKDDIEILFRRGFFGKGTLSRSEPTWRDRRLDAVRGGSNAAAEKIREERRLARKAFKIERAQAMMDAAKAAEAVLMAGQSPVGSETWDSTGQGEGGDGRSSPAPSTSASTVVDVSNLTPQTFLVRPTRPDSNRNRGRKAFERRPPGRAGATPGANAATTQNGQSAAIGPALDEVDDEVPGIVEELDESVVEEMEHLQLGLEEAWFLSAALGVLRVVDPATQIYTPIPAILPLFLTPPSTSPSAGLSIPTSLYPDDPFLVSYVCYHHFRSLGWVVKPGIKFCCDWLLYRRGPVFSHAAFSCVMVPVYSELGDRASSPYGHEDWYEERQSWKWINTVMRVNSLVQKTVVMVYITIPALETFPQSGRLGNGALDPMKHDMRSLLARYTIREVTLTRFGPARRRD